jgi:hypothetical protein
MDHETKITIANLLEHLHQQLLKRLGDAGSEDREAMNSLGAALLELSEAAQYRHDRFVVNMLDDMIYVLQETSMGSRAKGEGILRSLDDRVKELRREASYNREAESVRTMTGEKCTWSQFLAAAPELATYAKRRLEGRISYLATIRADGSPRVHPVSPFIAHGQLVLYMEPTSPKRHDLRRDSRYSMHAAVEDNTGGEGEFLVRGRAAEIDDVETRAQAFEQANAIGYNPQDRYVLFVLGIEEAVSTIYQDGEPKRMRWRASSVDG